MRKRVSAPKGGAVTKDDVYEMRRRERRSVQKRDEVFHLVDGVEPRTKVGVPRGATPEQIDNAKRRVREHMQGVKVNTYASN